MSRDLSAGPAAGAAWLPYPAPGAPGAPIMAVPDGANPQRATVGLPDLYHGLPLLPQVALDAAGQPVLSLSLLLERRPEPEDEDIFDLIDSAVLACDLTLALPQGAADATLRPLFARNVQMRLAAAVFKAHVLAEAQGWGANARMALGVRLDRADAQGVLKALHGLPSGLSLTCAIGYRSAGEQRDVNMQIDWAAVHDVLARHLEADDSLSDAALRALLPALLENGALEAWLLGPGPARTALAPAQADGLWKPFMMFSSMLLERVTPAPAPPGAGTPTRFVLRERPDEGARLDTLVTLDTSRNDATTLHAPLEEILGKVLDGLVPDRFIHLTCIDPDAPGGGGPVPRRVRSAPASRQAGALHAGATPAGAGLALVGTDAVSLTRALEPDSRARAPVGALLTSDAVMLHPGLAHAFSTHALELHQIDEPAEPLLPLPRVNDPNAPLWVDHSDASHFWYAPEYTLVAPDPAAAPDSASFLFSFHEISGHGEDVRPTLEGSIRFTLRRGASAATRQALDARPDVRGDPVSPTSLAVSLSLPMLDASGQLRRVDLPAQLTDAGDTITVKVAVSNLYVRIAYGDLAFAGFQPEAARLQIAYSFDAMVPVAPFALSLQNAGKLDLVPVAYTAGQQKQLAGRAHLDALQMTYRGGAADLQFRRETAAEPATEIAAAVAVAGGEAAAEAAPEAARGTDLAAVSTFAAPPKGLALQFVEGQLTPAILPKLEVSGPLLEMIKQRRYGRQTQGRSTALDVLLPCSNYIALYRQERDNASVGVGCQDSFSLGQAPLKLYQAVTDPGLASTKYKLYGSMTQSGRFLVLPTTYLITRFSPDERERAWRPTIHLYSTLDPVTAANNRCVLMATLQPDLSPRERHELANRLAQTHPGAIVEYVTALDSEVTYTWALPSGGAAVEVEASRMWDSFQVALATDRTGALLLQSMLAHTGVTGQAQFKLADGTILTSTLRLDLNQLTGPWDSGPVEVTLDARRATLTNRIERTVDVGDLVVASADGTHALAPCERALTPGEAVTLDLPLEAVQAWAGYTITPGDPATLTTINSFVENIDLNVLFCNLIEFAKHDLVKLSLMARIKQLPGSDSPVTWRAEDVGEVKFILPLTVYLGPRTLQFQVTKTDTAGAVTTTSWLESDLVANSVVSLVWDLIK